MPSTSRPSLQFQRERLDAFARFLWQRFLDDRCPQTAGALAYTTLFALVPLTAAVLGILSAFPVFQDWRLRLTDFVFDNFVPSAGKVVQSYLTQFADNASQATAVGVVILLVSAVSLMMSIEDAFNRIWRVATPRRTVARFLMYWTALSFGPLLVVAALAISSYLFALPLIDQAQAGLELKTRFLGVLPFLIVWVALAMSYMLVPNRSIRVREAVIGAFVAALLFDLTKRGFALYVTQVPSYEKVYGTLAVVPIFLLWIYLSWLVVLLGASLTAAASAFEFRRAHERLARGQEFLGLLCVVEAMLAAQREGRGVHSKGLCGALRFLTDDLLQRYLVDLHAAGLARRTEEGEWMLSRDPARATLREVYALGQYRVPLSGEPFGDVGCSPAGAAYVERLRGDLAGGLGLPLAEIFPPPPGSATPPPSVPEPSP